MNEPTFDTAVEADTDSLMTREESLAILAEEIWRAHRMTVDEYYAAREAGTLERSALDDAIDVFTGEGFGESVSVGED